MTGKPWSAWPDYGRSREYIVISGPKCEFLGHVDAWTGSLYWPVRDAKDVLVAHVRREVGGLYADAAEKSEAIQWAASVLLSHAASSAEQP